MKPEHYRALLNRAIASNNDELLNSMCAVLSENEQAKAILIQKGYGNTRMAIDAMVKLVPEDSRALLKRLCGAR
jgi:autonomous glycyl radical cofactor GrcA